LLALTDGQPRWATLAATAAGFVLLGAVVSGAARLTDIRIVIPVAAVWAAVAISTAGLERIATLSMMAAAATAPLNGVRAPLSLAMTDVFLIIAALALFARAAVAGTRPNPVPRWFLTGVLLIVVGGCLGTFLADNQGASLANLLRFTLSSVGPVLLFWAWRPDRGQLTRFAWVWVGGAVLSAVVALAGAGDASGRPAGLSGHPNHLAMISSLAAGLALVLAVTAAGRARAIAVGALAILTLGVLRAGSRAGLLVLAVTCAVVVVRVAAMRSAPGRVSRLAVVLGGLAGVSLVLVSTGIVDLGRHNAVSRFLGDVTTRPSDRSRAPLLAAGVQRIEAHPLTGSGFEKALESHNIYVQAWAAAGLCGLVGLLTIATGVIATGTRRFGDPEATSLAIAFVAGYMGYLVGGAFQNILWDRYLWLHITVVVWVGTAFRAGHPQADVPASPAPAALHR